jgi:hypothetical protein
VLDERDAAGVFEIDGYAGFAARELVGRCVGDVGGKRAVEAQDGGAVVREEEACEGALCIVSIAWSKGI